MKSILLSITSTSDFELEVFESDIDQIHFLMRYIPPLSVTSIVRKLKQESTLAIWQKYKKRIVKELLERTHLLERWIFCLLYRGGFS